MWDAHGRQVCHRRGRRRASAGRRGPAAEGRHDGSAPEVTPSSSSGGPHEGRAGDEKTRRRPAGATSAPVRGQPNEETARVPRHRNHPRGDDRPARVAGRHRLRHRHRPDQGRATFREHDRRRFSCTQPGAGSFIDLIAPQVREVVLNGVPLSVEEVVTAGRIGCRTWRRQRARVGRRLRLHEHR